MSFLPAGKEMVVRVTIDRGRPRGYRDLYFVGTRLLQRDIFFLLFAAAAIGGIHYQILQEERFLSKHYGEAYRRYLQTVPRYVGIF
jgi:hypothetical protein